MSPRDGYPDDDENAVTSHFDDMTVEALLAGNAPEGRADLAALADGLAALRGLAEAVPTAAARQRTVAMASAIARDGSAPPMSRPAAPRSSWPLFHRLMPNLARGALASLLVMVLGMGAAIAGILPQPLERAIAGFATRIGIDLPTPQPTATTLPGAGADLPVGSTTTTVSPTTTEGGPVVAVPAPTVALVVAVSPGEIVEPGGVVEFRLAVTNTTPREVVLRSLRDQVFGDLLFAANPALESNNCPAKSRTIGVGETLTCRYSAEVTGLAVDTPYASSTTVAVADSSGRTASDTFTSAVAIVASRPAVTIIASPSAGSLTEPGGELEIRFTIKNLSTGPVRLASMVDSVLGDLLDPNNGRLIENTCLPLARSHGAGAELECRVVAEFLGDAAAGSSNHSTRVVVADRLSNRSSATAAYVVDFADAAPDISLTFFANRLVVPESGGLVRFDVAVANLGQEPLVLTSLQHGTFGNLLTAPSTGVVETTCATGLISVPVGGQFICSFTRIVSSDAGVAGVTAVAQDNEGNQAQRSGSVQMGFPPPGTLVAGSVFLDFDRDGVQGSDEPGLAGVSVAIEVPGLGSMTLTTGSGGDWVSVVPAGEVGVTIDQSTVPSGMGATGGSVSQTVTVVAGEVTAIEPIGFWHPPQRVGGQLYMDFNGNRTRDAGEPGIPTVTMSLVDAGGVVVDTVTTGGSGLYSFVDNAAGFYTVRVEGGTLPGGIAVSSDPDGTADGATNLTAGGYSQIGGIDVGYRGTGSFTGGGVLPGSTVSVEWAGFDGVFGNPGGFVFSTTADSSGNYSIPAIPHGSFRQVP